jgi:flagellar hook-associated protein 2
MANASISGLASGLDTATIISQLMQLEAIPQNKLKTSLSVEQNTLKNLQTLNAKVAALTTQAQALASGTGWSALTVTSASDTVTFKTTGGTTGGSFTFSVDRVAAAHRVTLDDLAAGTDVVLGSGTTVDLTIGGVTKTLDTGDGTLNGLVAALNGPGTGVSAAKVRVATDASGVASYRLVVSALDTGAAHNFTLSNLGPATTVPGQDAMITMGPDSITSASNTFSGVIPGVDLTVSAASVGKSVDVTVAKDTTGVKDSVKSLVDAVNAALTQIDSLSSYNAASKTAGPLAGNAGVRALRNELLNSIYPGDDTSMAGVGLQTDRYGKLVFDEAKFSAAYAADPVAVAAKFTSGTVDGFAARVAQVADLASNKYTGTITSAITGRSTAIGRLEDSIEAWDRRLELRQASLQQRFTALETALSQMNSQSNWLAGQLGSLSGSSGS